MGVSADPWSITLQGRENAQPSLIALVAGMTSLISGGDTASYVLVAGAFGADEHGVIRPLPGPDWAATEAREPVPFDRWELDYSTGTLWATSLDGATTVIRFNSIVRPGIGALRRRSVRRRRTGAIANETRNQIDRPHIGAPVVVGQPAASFEWVDDRRDRPVGTGHRSTPDRIAWASTIGDRCRVTVAVADRLHHYHDIDELDRVAAVGGHDIGDEGALGALVEAVTQGRQSGFDILLDEHRRAWRQRWQHCDITIEGDDRAQAAIRFALFHLLSAASTGPEAPLGARGLTGLAYAGHIFWDTEIFVAPVLAATMPDAARALIEYRHQRLDAARRIAAERGRPGARFPWESADSGADVTPLSARTIDGDLVPILTGIAAEHINSDIAWTIANYVAWTGDDSVLTGTHRLLITETARYLADAIRVDDTGRAHLDGVIGPDEYHEIVDDNAFTNLMARWHLRYAADLESSAGDQAGGDRWRQLADSLVDGYDAATGRHEQFRGYYELEPLSIVDIAAPPIAADILLGRDRVRASQIIKQPDVLMAHHLLGAELPPGSLAADVGFYLARTAHGSSLSPAICAAVLARAARPDEALELWHLAGRLDLDDRTGTTAGGLHLATMGGLWQAVVSGFAGIRAIPTGLVVEPHLPSTWSRLGIRVRLRGAAVHIDIDRTFVTVESDRPIEVIVGATLSAAACHHHCRYRSTDRRDER